jgi:hypothetical protein
MNPVSTGPPPWPKTFLANRKNRHPLNHQAPGSGINTDLRAPGITSELVPALPFHSTQCRCDRRTRRRCSPASKVNPNLS